MSYQADDYIKYEQVEHILKIPDTYIGSVRPESRPQLIFDFNTNQLVEALVDLPEGLERVFLEILSNAGDNALRSRHQGVDPGQISIEMDNRTIIITNGGIPVPIAINSRTNQYAPTMIFGDLLTSSNYDETKDRIGCGRNGFGAKLTNIYSRHFSVEIGDNSRGLFFFQEWSNNMGQVSNPIIQSYAGPPYVKVSFTLDLPRFGYQEYPPEAYALFLRHALDSSFNAKVPVIFNQQLLDYRDIKAYGSLYFGDREHSLVLSQAVDPQANPYLEVLVVDTPYEGRCISFINGMMTPDGGVHVNATYHALTETLLQSINLRSKESKDKDKPKEFKLNLKDVKHHLSLLLCCHLPNPTFNSQSKTKLTSPKPKVNFSPEQLKPLNKWAFVDCLRQQLLDKQLKEMTKTDGKKVARVGIKKAVDANEAGRANSASCCLFITEGDSAQTFAIKAIKHLPGGSDLYGTYPMKGKPLNVMNALANKPERIITNQELADLKKMLGIREGLDYKDPRNYQSLRYGSLIIMADSDDDGKHIVGLILLLFHCLYPSLLEIGYVGYLRTPIVKMTRGKQTLKFYREAEYQRWYQAVGPEEAKRWTTRYLKGLASSDDTDIAEEFGQANGCRVVTWIYDETTPLSFKLVFDEKESDRRKTWIAQHAANLEVVESEWTTMSQFLEKEVVEYCRSNLIRSIPRLLDGLKESQRKVLWGVYRKWGGKGKLKTGKNAETFKVNRLANYVSEKTGYKHGEVCLEDTINNMVFSFPGTNNLPYLSPNGQFGTRLRLGKDGGSSRYTATKPMDWLPYVYREEDMPILTQVFDEGDYQEPETFLPIIPMCLINGAYGIGSGHSTFVPNYNPEEVVAWLQQRLLADLQQ